ncbi:MAG: vitamin K epoxide reductase family protein [Candidatus Pacearchaeota archaeon]
MKSKQKYIILLILTLISLVSSIILSLPTESSDYCSFGEEGGCDIVHGSKYNYTLGIQNSYFGIIIFSFLFLLIYSQIKNPSKNKENSINFLIIFGSLIALYFLYIQHFVLNSYCTYCIITDFSLLISLGIIIWKWNK